MVSQYDKAIAAFLTSLIGLIAAFSPRVKDWFNPDMILAITPFIAMIVTFLVPNKSPVLMAKTTTQTDTTTVQPNPSQPNV
jgi:hypothetical protein